MCEVPGYFQHIEDNLHKQLAEVHVSTLVFLAFLFTSVFKFLSCFSYLIAYIGKFEIIVCAKQGKDKVLQLHSQRVRRLN